MNEGVKSALVVGQGRKESEYYKQIEYKQVSHKDDIVGELSDEQKEAEFNRQHQEYIKMKLNRKKELLRLKREQFGTSSSDENDNSSQEEIGEIKPKKESIKRSRGKIENKPPQHPTFPVVLELKKLSVDTELVLLDKEFEVNKRTLPYSKLVRLQLFAVEEGKAKRKVRVVMVDEEFSLFYNDSEVGLKDKTDEIFLRMLKAKLDSKEAKFLPLQRKTPVSDYTAEQKDGALAYDLIFKKSQVFGAWEERYVVIKPEGLYSYRTLKTKATMFIPPKEVKEIQTQFDYYKDLLVVRLVYNSTRTDFGLPIDPQLEWVTHFASLIPQ